MPSGKARKTRSLTQPRPQALTSASQIGGAAVTSLEALTPPAEAQDAHDGLINAGEDLV